MYTETPVIKSIVKLKRNRVQAEKRPGLFAFVHVVDGYAYWADGYFAVMENANGVEGMAYPISEYDQPNSPDQIVELFAQNMPHPPAQNRLGEDLYQQAREARETHGYKMPLYGEMINPTFVFDLTRTLRKKALVISSLGHKHPLIIEWDTGRALIMPLDL